jgi:folate-dependent phosphoribosylglycinamide formyltransferase PurN
LLDLMEESTDFTCDGRPVIVSDIIVDDDDFEFAMAWKARLWRTTQKAMPTSTIAGWRIGPRLHRVSTKILRQKPNSLTRDDRSAARDEVESALLAILNSTGCEAAICDSYMTVFGSRFLEGAKPVLINLHPGITTEHHPAQLLGPTPNRDAYTRARFGYIIVDDKARMFWPEGVPCDVEHEGKIRQAIAVSKTAETGVTAHHVEKAVDRGRVVAQASYQFDAALESEDSLRSKNYALKLPVLKTALEKVFGTARA